jgi:hypothetical protein
MIKSQRLFFGIPNVSFLHKYQTNNKSNFTHLQQNSINYYLLNVLNFYFCLFNNKIVSCERLAKSAGN